MDTPTDEAAHFLREASKCLELASLMSLKPDRERMTEMAQRWLGLAQQAEAKRDLPSGPPPRPQSVAQPMQQQQQKTTDEE